MYFDKRIFYFILAVMLFKGLYGYLTNVDALLGLLFTIPGILVAITFHEFAHAKTADYLGDDTPRNQGRITLNPLAHIEPVGLILLLFSGFGWGKPVQVNPRNYNRDITIEKGECIVSLAGPLMNFILALLFTIIYFAIYKYVNVGNQILIILTSMLYDAIFINVGLGVFNLIPLPPLDGSKVIKPFLPYNVKRWFEEKEQLFYIVFIVLWFSGLAGDIISPIINVVFSGIIKLGSLIFNL